jgi:hypothetical protein
MISAQNSGFKPERHVLLLAFSDRVRASITLKFNFRRCLRPGNGTQVSMWGAHQLLFSASVGRKLMSRTRKARLPCFNLPVAGC